MCLDQIFYSSLGNILKATTTNFKIHQNLFKNTLLHFAPCKLYPAEQYQRNYIITDRFIKAHLQNCILFAFVFKTSVANCCKNCKRWRILGNADLWQTRVEICQGFDFAFFFRFGFFRLLRLALFFSVNNKKGMYKDFEYDFLLSIHLCYNFCGYEFDKYSLYYHIHKVLFLVSLI